LHDSGHPSHGAELPFSPGTSQYGKIAFVLDKKRMIDRTTFTVVNSSGSYYRPGDRRPIFTPKNPISLFDAMYEYAQYNTKTVAAKIKDVTRSIKNGAGVSGLSDYTEAQFIGGVTLDDVKVVMIPEQWKNAAEYSTEIRELTSMLDRKKIPYAFHKYASNYDGVVGSVAESRKAAKAAIAAAKK
jgi:hypothetical protein